MQAHTPIAARQPNNSPGPRLDAGVGRRGMNAIMRKRLLSILLLASWCANAHDGDIAIKSGFVTGTQYRTFTEPDRRKYAMGLLDGIFLAPFFKADKKQLELLERCATGMNDTQVVAILDKYLRDNPVRWHESMNALAFVALKEACAN